MLKKTIAAACLTALFMTPAAAGLNLKNRSVAKKHDADIAKQEKALNRNCGGTAIKMKVDWSTFKNEDMHEHRFMSSVMGNFLRSITQLCVKDEGKEAIKASIKNIVITNGLGIKEVKVNLKEGTLTYAMDPKINTNAIYKKTTKYLEENL